MDEHQELLDEVATTMRHALTFIRSRERMHPDGVQLYGSCLHRVEEARAALAAKASVEPVGYIIGSLIERNLKRGNDCVLHPRANGMATTPVFLAKAAAPAVPDVVSVLRFAAQTIELYDDAMLNADYMLSSTDAAEILAGLESYPFAAAPSAPDGKEVGNG